jgi:hypothetical protein
MWRESHIIEARSELSYLLFYTIIGAKARLLYHYCTTIAVQAVQAVQVARRQGHFKGD